MTTVLVLGVEEEPPRRSTASAPATRRTSPPTSYLMTIGYPEVASAREALHALDRLQVNRAIDVEDRVLELLQRDGGRVVQASLSAEAERRLRAVMVRRIGKHGPHWSSRPFSAATP